MRRTHAARISSPRPQLAFEPLEPRELLAADVGFDWWSASDYPVDDWSWTFDDASTFDAGGAWWDDSWWAGDASWDASADGTDFDVAGYEFDAGVGYDWTANVGGPDAGSTQDGEAVVEIVAPPSPGDAVSAADTSPVTVSADVAPESPYPAPQVVVVSPGVGAPVLSPIPVVLSVAGDAVDDVEFFIERAPQSDDAHVTAIDVVSDEDSFVEEAVLADATDDAEDGGWWVLDWAPMDGPSPQPTDGIGADEDPVVDVVADDPIVPPTVVVVTPRADGPSPIVAVPVASAPASAPGVADRFAGWGAIFFSAFGRPNGEADGSLAGAQAGGQPGSGRPRLRLPFRPIA